MERLTKWIDDGEKRQAIPDPEIRSNGHGKCCNKLAALEDLEEQDCFYGCHTGNQRNRVRNAAVRCQRQWWISSGVVS